MTSWIPQFRDQDITIIESMQPSNNAWVEFRIDKVDYVNRIYWNDIPEVIEKLRGAFWNFEDGPEYSIQFIKIFQNSGLLITPYEEAI